MKRIACSLVLFLLVGLTAVAILFHGLSEAALRAPASPPRFVGTLPSGDDEAIQRGLQLVTTRGCSGCHGEDLRGSVLPWGGRAVAANLTRYVRDHDLSTFERAVRHGIGADGKSLVFMPSYMFRHLSDNDFLDMVAYLKSLEPQDDDLPRASLDRKMRWALITGQWVPMAEAVKRMPDPEHPKGADPEMAQGEYLALTSCTECHGLDLRGWRDADWSTPDLALAAAYPEKDFQRLLTEGVALGDRELTLMKEAAKSRFSHFTEDERRQIHRYLKTLAERPVRPAVFWRAEP
jgi:mono/diheme cytochrome c family protein